MDFEEQLRKFELELPASLRYQTTQMAVARPYLSFQVCMSSKKLRVTFTEQLLVPFTVLGGNSPSDPVAGE
jgi:hypothetical protein